MKDQEIAADVVKSMVRNAKSFPVSVKTRTGVDESDSFDYIHGFIQRLVDAGCRSFVIHSRKVFTEGLSPARNRTVPPLSYPFAYRLMHHFPQCTFVINGGLMNLKHCRRVAFGSSVTFDVLGNEMTGDIEQYEQHSVPCEKCDLPNGSCLTPQPVAPVNLSGK